MRSTAIVRPSRRPLRGLLRKRTDVDAIHGFPHPEERASARVSKDAGWACSTPALAAERSASGPPADGAKVSRNFTPPPTDPLSSWGGQRSLPWTGSGGNGAPVVGRLAGPGAGRGKAGAERWTCNRQWRSARGQH